MAKKRKNIDYKPEDIMFPEQVITSSELVQEMKTSYIEYAMSVIVSRALPDVRDGLKPVHRRILYAMYEDGLTHDKPVKKCATAVGNVLGRYHPHGDASVYDALVRLAQDFSMRYPLIDGHGNFGSVDGDPPAAYRYTEARMSKMADEMLEDIEKDTVDWDPNFDESRKEPRVLPSRFPNLLVNGSSGIAVGMATNIPPHNLREVINATITVLDNPDTTMDELLNCVQGPDFPTKGIIMGRRGIRAAYATGKGHITVRARTEFEEYGKDRVRIIITELPYQVNKRMLVKSIADQVREKRLDGISDLREESDRNGMRVVIELKKDANPQVVLNKLYKQTQMQITFAVNMLALVNNQSQPKVLTLREIIDEYIAYQKEIITRRTRFDLRKAQERAHLIEGLLIAQANIDEVIRIIRNSYDNAKENLMERFSLSEVQASAILEMRLKALQGLEEEKLNAEYKALEEKIKYFNEILASEELLKKVLRDELTEISDRFGDDRVTEIQDVEDEIDIEDLIEEKTCVYTFTSHGYIKRQPEELYKVQRRGGIGVTAMSTKEEDVTSEMFTGSTHNTILFFTSRGRMFRKKGYEIPESSRQARGMNIVNLLQLDPEERVTTMIPLEEYDEELVLNFVTKQGVAKRCKLEAFKHLRNRGIIAMGLKDDDELISVMITDGEQDIIVASHKGMVIRYNEKDMNFKKGRNAGGVRAIRLADDDYVVGAVVADEEKTILTVTENGYGKRTPASGFNVQRRGGRGVRGHKISEKTGLLAGIKAVSEEEDVVVISSEGILIRIRISDIPVYGRTSGGVRIMRFRGDDKVTTIAALPSSEDEETQKLELDAEDMAEAEEAAEEPIVEEEVPEDSEESDEE